MNRGHRQQGHAVGDHGHSIDVSDRDSADDGVAAAPRRIHGRRAAVGAWWSHSPTQAPDTLRRDHWDLQSNCTPEDTEAMFSISLREQRDAAAEICTGCPVRDRCLAEALDRDEQFGVWGGVPAGTAEFRHLRDASEQVAA